MVSTSDEKIVCSVGVTAYNEEENIGHLLEALIDQHLHDTEIAEIIVVASACTDRTVSIVREYMARDPRVRLIEQQERSRPASTRFCRRRPISVLRAAIRCRMNMRVEHLVRMFRPWAWSAQKIAVDTPDHIVGC